MSAQAVAVTPTLDQAMRAQTAAWVAFHDHARGCERCGGVRRALVAPEPGMTVAAASLRLHVANCCEGGAALLLGWGDARFVCIEIRKGARA